MGNTQETVEMMRSLESDLKRLDQKRQFPIHRAMNEAAKTISSNPSVFGSRLNQWEASNIERFDLRASLKSAAEAHG
jgi:hypothetical protein